MSVYETSITNPKKQLEFYKDLSEQLQQENQQLKKQLHEASLEIQHLIEQDIDCPSNCNKLRKLKNQQKEFIKWLEKEIKTTQDRLNKYNEKVKNREETDIEYYLSTIDERKFDIYMKTLRKYKEIVGVKDE